MKNFSFHILRIGVAITFILIAIFIFQNPIAWGGYIKPWAKEVLIFPVEITMILTAIFDLIVGSFLLFNILLRPVLFFAFFHILIVLFITGINSVTVRDIAILTAIVSLFFKK